MALRGQSQSGFVLVAVLAVMAVLAGLTAAVTLVTRSAVGSARVVIDDLVADALTRAGFELAAYQLFVRQQSAGAVDGQQIRLDDGTVTLFVSSPAGLVDLNRSGPALLAAAYRAAKLRRLTPDTFAGRVIDWRDEDDDLAEHGAEAGDYGGAGLAYGPANMDFRTVDELRWVLGVPPGDVKALKPFLTVANPAGLVDAFEAAPPVLAALDLAPQDVARILALRRVRSEGTAERIKALIGEREETLSADVRPLPLVRLTVEVAPNSGPKRSIVALLTRDPMNREPYLIVGR